MTAFNIMCSMSMSTLCALSMSRNSCLRGWRLFALLCCWFTCSDILKPFLLTYLQQNAADPSRTYHNAASTCLLALRKTLKYGGRRNVPTSEEITAIAVCTFIVADRHTLFYKLVFYLIPPQTFLVLLYFLDGHRFVIVV